MINFLKRKTTNQDEIRMNCAKLISYCHDLDRFTNFGYLHSCINRKYKYLGKTYTTLNYRISVSNNVILYNEDYDVIYATNNKQDCANFLNKLYMGAMANV